MQVTHTIVVNTILYDKVGATTVVSDDPEVWVGLAAVVRAKMDSEGRGYNGCNRHFGYPFCLLQALLVTIRRSDRALQAL